MILMFMALFMSVYFFFNDTATTEIYTLSLHDALPIYFRWQLDARRELRHAIPHFLKRVQDRKSTRLNSSHMSISYAVFCLKKKNTNDILDEPHYIVINLSYHYAYVQYANLQTIYR